MFNKVSDAGASLSCIRDDSVVAISGFNLATAPEYLILELFNRHLKTGHPENLFVMSDALPAMPGRAFDAVAEKLYKDREQKFLRGVLMPFLGFSPWLQKLVADDRVEAYGWPLGIAAYWFREVASGRPGLVTRIGVDTFLDPRQDGAALNQKGERKMSCRVSVISLAGEEHLFYQAPKPDFALIRASLSDENGNLSMRDEGIRGTTLSIAQAVKARPNSGSVVAQVRWLAKAGSISPRDVDIPSPLVDHVTLAPKEYHWQGGTIEFDPRVSHSVVPPLNDQLVTDMGAKHAPPSDAERIVARRVLLELARVLEEKGAPAVVNLGIGIPAFVSAIAAEEGITEYIITVLESGPWGGLALAGPDFGLAISPFAVSTIPDMFSNFEGGIIDAASLGFLQIDRHGNVNPSMLPDRLYGPGGFPVIAGGAPKTYFAGGFTGGPFSARIVDGKLQIDRDGAINKFVNAVYKTVFSGHQALKYGKEILYVTERAVFSLSPDGLVLREAAPGIDIERQILGRMDFVPLRPSSVQAMDSRLFRREKMGLLAEILEKLRR